MPAYTGSGEVWREVPSIPQLLVSSEGRVMVKPYRSDMPNGGARATPIAFRDELLQLAAFSGAV